MKKVKRVVVGTVILPAVLVAAVGLAAAAGLSTALGSVLGGTAASARAGVGTIPAAMLRLYGAAARVCPGLPYTVLAAIGAVESDHGRAPLPGVHSGHNPAGAEGPMQFLPDTFAAYAEPVPPGGADPPSPYDPVDAAYAAARMLCADGAGDPARLGAALFDYNHSGSYVAEVLARAGSYGLGPSNESGGEAAVEYALAQVGAPYRWGGESPAGGFDCSGLTQAAWAAAGVSLPRLADAQFEAGPRVEAGDGLAPGDLVFFGPGPGDATHVGIVVDPAGVMVDAPHNGAAVRVEAFPSVVGAKWGSDSYLGATAPAL